LFFIMSLKDTHRSERDQYFLKLVLKNYLLDELKLI